MRLIENSEHFKSIDSDEKFGIQELKMGDAPRHTERGHERCAYYRTVNFGDNTAKDGLFCPHGFESAGAFYSEDFIKRVKEVAHRIDVTLGEDIKDIAELKTLFEGM